MATRVVEKHLLRWSGRSGDIRALAEKAAQYISDKTGAAPSSKVTTAHGHVETRFDDFDEFEAGTAEDFKALQKVVVPWGSLTETSL